MWYDININLFIVWNAITVNSNSQVTKYFHPLYCGFFRGSYGFLQYMQLKSWTGNGNSWIYSVYFLSSLACEFSPAIPRPRVPHNRILGMQNINWFISRLMVKLVFFEVCIFWIENSLELSLFQINFDSLSESYLFQKLVLLLKWKLYFFNILLGPILDVCKMLKMYIKIRLQIFVDFHPSKWNETKNLICSTKLVLYIYK